MRDDTMVLVVRDPDGGDDVRVWVDGCEIKPTVVMIDAGRGHEYGEWLLSGNETVRLVRRDHGDEAATAVMCAYNDPPGREYIDGWPDEEDDAD